MWQTLGLVTNHSVSMATGRSGCYALDLHQHHAVSSQGGDISVLLGLEERNRDLLQHCSLLGSEEEEVPTEADLGSNMGEEAPLCSQTDMEELRRSCSESQCASGDTKDHVRT